MYTNLLYSMISLPLEVRDEGKAGKKGGSILGHFFGAPLFCTNNCLQKGLFYSKKRIRETLHIVCPPFHRRKEA